MEQIPERNVPSGGSRSDFDLGAVADGLDGERRARAASRITAHFNEIRSEIEALQTRVMSQGKLIGTLEARLAAVEAKSPNDAAGKAANEVKAKEANAAPRRRGFLPFAPGRG